VLRFSKVTRCAASSWRAGIFNATGSPARAITSGAKPIAPTGSASSPSRSDPSTGTTDRPRRGWSDVPGAAPGGSAKPSGDGCTPGSPKAGSLVRLQAGGQVLTSEEPCAITQRT
jgi:hypothetical protein